MIHAPANMPPPMAMPSLSAIVRAANEECTNVLESKRGAAARIGWLETVELPHGGFAAIECRYSSPGVVETRIRVYGMRAK